MPADYDGWLRAFMHADGPEPCREPIERLECGQVGALFEGAPIALDRTQVFMQQQLDAQPVRTGSGNRRRQIIGFGIRPKRVFDLAFEHDLCRHDIPGRTNTWRRVHIGQLT